MACWGGMRNPVRVIVAGEHGVPVSARVFSNARRERVIYATFVDLPPSQKKKLQKMRVEILLTKRKRGQIDLPQLMDKLGAMGITSIMVEGGSEVSANVIKEKLIDKVIYFIAPKIIGGKGAPGPVGGQGIKRLKDVLRIKDMTVAKLGDDLVVEGYI